MMLKRIVITVITAVMLAIPVLAHHESEGVFYIAEDFGTDCILEAVPDEVLNKLPTEDIFTSDGFVSGFSAEYFARTALVAVRTALGPAFECLTVTLGLVLIASGISALKNLFSSPGLICLVEFVSGLCIMLTLYSTVLETAKAVSLYLSQLSGLMYAMLPVMIAILTVGGNISAASVSSGAMMLGVTLVETLASGGLFPIIQLCLGMSVASNIGGGLKLGGISKLVRNAVAFILGLISASISAIMTFQTSIASKADSLSMRAVKFAASSGIPVVGSIAGDAVGAVAESLSLVKSAVGWVGVIIIALMTLPVTLEVILARIGIMISETAADILGLDRERAVLSEISGLFGFLVAVCVICGLMFVYAAALFAVSRPALL